MKHNRLKAIAVIVFLPVTILLWMVGWTLYILGDKVRPKKENNIQKNHGSRVEHTQIGGDNEK